uniref:von Willebrand factor D and EGF domain-containing protein-like isoform X1 n=1 Tax=Crassostrea virginica TaxID=6565 RepID=A0A8B8EIU5_CRAVI|nr:von Willebrand factor D and EGF domain-containing protein-like isoform X1 [Crassostrea virginica]XP_022339999.1 von Willebrand factor D and EGF domain-containing protein-like isoform X1 [Crassostrea virginica]
MDPTNCVIFPLLGIILIGVKISVSQDPCLDGNSLELDHTVMAIRSPSLFFDFTPICDDKYIADAWYKAKKYVMTTSPPRAGYCGTLYPIWLNDSIPPVGLTRTLSACEVRFSGDCERVHEVVVKNCTNFLVYKIKPLHNCFTAYCFELNDNCCMDQAIDETVSSIRVSFHNVTWKTQGHSSIPGLIRHDPSINLLCSFTPSANDTLLYHIDWYVDNDTVIQGQTVDKDSLQDAILSAEDMNKAGKKINSWIHCVVGIKTSVNDSPSSTKSSNSFFAGLEVLNQTLSMQRKGNSTLMIRPTIPFVSETIEVNGQQSTSPLNIQLSFPGDNGKCQKQSGGNLRKCSIELDSYTHDDRQKYEDPTNWNKVYNIEVFNTDDEGYYLTNHKLVLRLETNGASGDGAQIFANADFHDVHINVVEDQEAWKGKRCSSYADPHQTTFDGYRYECQSTGCISGKTYIFYRNEQHLQELQVRHGSCWGRPRCVCAVAARAGQDVFTMDFCSGKQDINFPLCNENTLKVIKEHDKRYKIFFPTGTSARVSLYNFGSYFFYINLEVYPTVADVSRTSGLCGFLDDDHTNDLRHRDGTQDNVASFSYYNPPDAFSLSWQLSTGSTEDLLSNSQSVYDQLTRLSSYVQKLCTCDEGKTQCSYKQYSECKTNIRGKEYHCVLHSTSSGRNKRDLQHLRLYTENQWKSSEVARFKRQTYNTLEAYDICDEAFQQSSYYNTCLQVVPNFSNETLDNCISDIVMTGEHNLTQLHLDTALGLCQAYILLNSTLQSEHPDMTTLVINLCPNNCNNRGVCSEGNCTCDSGYGGSDCSFDVLSPPTITGLSGNGVCDKSTETCDDITLYGHYFVENMGTTCYVTREDLQGNESDTGVSSASYTVQLEERTLFEGYVSLQYSQENAWITTFKFNMSNDDTQFSEMYTVYVYQSKCQTFNNNSGDVSFTLQSGFCYIDGQCIQDGASKNNDTCLQCKPTSDAFNWTDCTTENTMPSTMGASSTSSTVQIPSSTAQTVPPNIVPRLTERPSTENKTLRMKLIGLIIGVAIVSIMIIAVVGYMIKTKIYRKISGHNDVLDEQTCRPDKNTKKTGIGNDNHLFYFDSCADMTSRPPSSTSLWERALSPTNDFTKVFPPQSHRLSNNVRPIQVWNAK